MEIEREGGRVQLKYKSILGVFSLFRCFSLFGYFMCVEFFYLQIGHLLNIDIKENLL